MSSCLRIALYARLFFATQRDSRQIKWPAYRKSSLNKVAHLLDPWKNQNPCHQVMVFSVDLLMFS